MAWRAFGRSGAFIRGWAAPELDDETRAHVAPELRDLAALANGGLTLACSDAFFGPMNNLLLPGRPTDMGGGWETRRRRGPGHDWILVKLGARGAPAVVEVDTRHFKGNFPDRCSLEAIDAPAGARITDLVGSDAWRPLVPEAKLRADARHFFPVDRLRRRHARAPQHLSRRWRRPAARLGAARCLTRTLVLNALSPEEARAALTRCCGSARWVAGMLARRPWASAARALRGRGGSLGRARARRLSGGVRPPPAHRRARPSRRTTPGRARSRRGSRDADGDTRRSLVDANERYLRRFGYIFIVCASGKSAAEMLALLEARLGNAPERELAIAAGEQARITRLRLEKLAA